MYKMVLLCFLLDFLDHYVFICFMGIQISPILISLFPFVKLFLFHLPDVYSIFSSCHSKSVSILVYLALGLYRLIFVAYIKGLPCPLYFGEFNPWETSRKSDSGRKVMSGYLLPSPCEMGHTLLPKYSSLPQLHYSLLVSVPTPSCFLQFSYNAYISIFSL